MLLPEPSMPSNGVGGLLDELTVIVTSSGSLTIPSSLVTASWNTRSVCPIVSVASKSRLSHHMN